MRKQSDKIIKSRPAGHTWMDNVLFSLIIDYYPEIPGRPYGSGATRENIIPVFKALKPGFVAIYAKGHSGRTTFKSSLRTEHVMLAKDMPKLFREVCRETGVKLGIYYSGMIDGIASLRHPEWRMLDPEGNYVMDKSIFMMHSICPQSDYFREWAAVHLTEIMTRYDPDAVWVDGDWSAPCYCPKCVGRFRAETGYKGKMPGFHDETPEGVAWRKTWTRITHEHRLRFRGLIKKLNPGCLYSAGNVNPRLEHASVMDWRSGDWFSPNRHRLQQSMAMRRYTVQRLPYDAMTCDTSFIHSWPDMRSRTKPLDRMLQEGAGVIANGGKWCYWTYPMPNGALIPSKMEQAKKALAFAEQRRAICINTDSISWTAIMATDYPWCVPSGVENSLYGAGKALIHLHRSPDLIDEDCLTSRSSYELIVLPEQINVTRETAAKLERFVRSGGKLLSSGAAINSPHLQKLLGVKLGRKAIVNDGHVFLKDRRPAGVFAPWDEIVPGAAETLYPLYRSWDQDNIEMREVNANYSITGMVDEENPELAGIPAATIRKLGKGTAVHIPTDVFSIYWRYGYPDILAWLKEILNTLQPEPFFQTDALSFVEVALRRKAGDLLIHFVNGNPGRDIAQVGSKDLWVDDIPPIGPITSRIRCSARPSAVYIEPGRIAAATTYRNGVLEFVLPRLEIHSCVVVKGMGG